ncbi:MAG: hypothetical protein K6A41_07140 [Bacteroidales bacterium]|nr:hypothetical protein [Bacteroidales bacterium]
MKKIVLLFVMVVVATVGYGQYYGLLGKRVIFNLEGTTSPAYLHSNLVTEALINKYGEDKSHGILSLNFFATPSVEVAVWKKGTVGAGYSFFTSPFEGMQHDLYSGQYQQGYQFPVYSDYSVFSGHVTAHGIQFYYKQYVGNTEAPIGHYFKFNFDLFLTKYIMDDVPDYATDSVPIIQQTLFYMPGGEYDPEVKYSLEEIRTGKGKLFGLRVEYGYDFWPLSFMKLSVGASLGTTFGGYRGISTKYDGFTDFSKRTFEGYSYGRILGAYWLQFKLGIGFSAF